MSRYGGLSVYTGNAHPAFAKAICEYLDSKLADLKALIATIDGQIEALTHLFGGDLTHAQLASLPIVDGRTDLKAWSSCWPQPAVARAGGPD